MAIGKIRRMGLGVSLALLMLLLLGLALAATSGLGSSPPAGVLQLPAVQFASGEFAVEEGAGTALITATLDNAGALTVTVGYEMGDGTAWAGSDYVAASGVLTFAPGTLTQTFEVTILDDPWAEADETILLSLRDPANANLGTPDEATLTIADDGDSLVRLHVPLVMGSYDPLPEPLLEENFESGTDGWEPFLNYWRLNPEQWYLEAGAGREGSTGLRHSAFLGATTRSLEAEDALYMYLGDGAEAWTDYRVEAWVRMDDGEQMGLWVRGRFMPVPDAPGLYVEGYYLTWQPDVATGGILLARIPDTGPEAHSFRDAEVIASGDSLMSTSTWYRLTVEVRGSTIRVLVDGNPVLEHEDGTYGMGTIGFYAYRVNYGTWDDLLVIPLQ